MQQPLLKIKNELNAADFASFLQKQGDVFFSAENGVWIVTSYESAKEAYLHPGLSADRLPYFEKIMMHVKKEEIDYFFKVVSKFMVMSDAPKHTSRRRICYHAITNDLVERLKSRVEKTITIRVGKLQASEEIDLVKDFFEVIIIDLLSELFNVPDNKRNEFFKAASTMTQFFGGLESYTNEHVKNVNNAAKTLYYYFKDLLIETRNNILKVNSSDLIGALLHYQVQYDLSDNELVSQCIMILVAGQVTTIDQASNILNQYFLASEDTKQKLKEKDIGKVVEEFSRFDPAVAFNVRIAKEDLMLSDKNIKAGDVVMIANIAANYDNKSFPKSQETDFDRVESKPLNYGFGAHFCLGSKIARMVLEEIFEAIEENFSDWKFSKNNPAERKPESLAFSGYKNLPIYKKITSKIAVEE